MKIKVSRSTGDVLSPDLLIEPLATAESIGTLKGQQYLYDEGFNKLNYTVTMPYRNVMYPSDIVSIQDSSLAGIFTGRCVGHSINITNDNNVLIAESTLTVERCELE